MSDVERVEMTTHDDGSLWQRHLRRHADARADGVGDGGDGRGEGEGWDGDDRPRGLPGADR